mmetsp:Transcript_76126/g.235012  ORF Transcript_76126/g.235012 Transcript_76126/m.235012 type:complete len:298 (-) Transcript_76126:78-971(-)
MFVCLLMGTIWSVYVTFHVLPLLQVQLPPGMRQQQDVRAGILHLLVSQILSVFVVICYARAMLTLPGSVPDTQEWKLFGRHEVDGLRRRAALTKEVKLSGGRRHCKWCAQYKPDRCHHCRVCGTCVLRMDHHCPWIMNCVGFRNHKYFFLLVIYSVAACGFIATTLLESVRRSLEQEMAMSSRFMMVLGLVLSVIIGTLMLIFFFFHVHLMLNGMTTIEYCEKNALAHLGGANKRQSYDRGFYRNLKAVLGSRPAFWLLPTSPPEGDGTSFQGEPGDPACERDGDKADPEWTSSHEP